MKSTWSSISTWTISSSLWTWMSSCGSWTPRLVYWLREQKSANAEVDFVIASGNQVIPVEVKAGKSGALKSLQQFVLHKKAGLCVRFDLNRPAIQDIVHAVRSAEGSSRVSYRLLSLPLYLAQELPRILDEIRLGEGR